MHFSERMMLWISCPIVSTDDGASGWKEENVGEKDSRRKVVVEHIVKWKH